jgi:hexosaminidase
MKRLKIILPCILVALLWAGPAELLSAPGTSPGRPVPPLIPTPQSLRLLPGEFILTPETRILVDYGDEFMGLGEYLSQQVRAATRLILPISLREAAGVSAGNTIVLTTDQTRPGLGVEGYELFVGASRVLLRAPTATGLFYGIQTLLQLLPAGPDPQAPVRTPARVTLPCLQVEDQPRFSWRGLNLDCGRHFMSKEFVKRYIDLLARFKMNRLHWHLTEDQGWRIEIKAYPEFTAKGAWRRTEDGAVYGGFYTQEDIREVVAYAQSRFVMVVPEIEMPGHSAAALAAYPDLSCTGGPFEVQNYWGIHSDVYCAGSEKTFEVLEGVLSEVVDLFPSPYVHIGGDECPKARWKACPKCQSRIQAEGLKDEAELQSYFIRRIEQFLLTKNRRIIGWDEILEGGLAPQATVQSWRGFAGAVAAARSGHDTIVSPTQFTYFDYDLQTTDLRKAYAFEPVPPQLSPAESRHILGGECNMWSEYAPQEEIDGKLFPRILAIAERLWSPAAVRDFGEFQARVWKQADRLRQVGVQVGDETHAVSLAPAFKPETKTLTVSLKPSEPNLSLRFTTDGSEPTRLSPRYVSPLVVDKSCRVQARAFKGRRPYGEPVARDFAIHKALGRIPQLQSRYGARRSGGGDGALTDGIRGDPDMDGPAWQGFEGVDLEAVLDLGRSRSVTRIAVGFLQDSSHDVFLPSSVEFAVSDDGQNFRVVGAVPSDMARDNPDPTVRDFALALEGVRTRYIRVIAPTLGVCPPRHPDAGKKAWLMADEIVVD